MSRPVRRTSRRSRTSRWVQRRRTRKRFASRWNRWFKNQRGTDVTDTRWSWGRRTRGSLAWRSLLQTPTGSSGTGSEALGPTRITRGRWRTAACWTSRATWREGGRASWSGWPAMRHPHINQEAPFSDWNRSISNISFKNDLFQPGTWSLLCLTFSLLQDWRDSHLAYLQHKTALNRPCRPSSAGPKANHTCFLNSVPHINVVDGLSIVILFPTLAWPSGKKHAAMNMASLDHLGSGKFVLQELPPQI